MTKWMAAGMGALTALGFAACEKPGQVHEGKAKIVRTYVNRRDASGTAQVTDVEISLEGCNADLRMVARGGGPFAACVEKKAAGAQVSVKVRAGRTRDGRRTSEIVAIDECARDHDPTDSRSFEAFRACTVLKTDDIPVGFRCEVAPTEAAKTACPWLGP